MRVLVALNPVMYRQTIIFFLEKHRPHLELKSADPADLDQELASFKPDLLICHETIPAVRQRVLSQVEILYSDGLDALVCIEERESRINNINVQDLLSTVDETATVVSSEEQSDNTGPSARSY
jgi:hypothetical protein